MSVYEFNGEKYKAASAHQKMWGSKLIEQLDLKGNETILDLGCGDGVLTKMLAMAADNGKVLGIDASLGMINEASKLESNNLHFIRKDINNIDYMNRFDVIFSNAALHWVRDHKRLINHSYKALKTGGRLIWNFACKGNCKEFNSVAANIIASDKFNCYFKGFECPWYMPDTNEYRKLDEWKQFSYFDAYEENADTYFENDTALVKWIDQPCIVPFLCQITKEDDRELFRKEVISEMIKSTRCSNGSYLVSFRRINVYAVK